MFLSVVFISVKTIGDLQGKMPGFFKKLETGLQVAMVSLFVLIYSISVIWYKLPQWLFNVLMGSILIVFEISFAIGNLLFGLHVFCNYQKTFTATKSSKAKEVIAKTRSTLTRIFCLIFVGVSLAIVISVSHISNFSKSVANQYGVFAGENKEPMLTSVLDVVSGYFMFCISNVVCIVASLSFRKLPPREQSKKPDTHTNLSARSPRSKSGAHRQSGDKSGGSSTAPPATDLQLAIVPTFDKKKSDMRPIDVTDDADHNAGSTLGASNTFPLDEGTSSAKALGESKELEEKSKEVQN